MPPHLLEQNVENVAGDVRPESLWDEAVSRLCKELHIVPSVALNACQKVLRVYQPLVLHTRIFW